MPIVKITIFKKRLFFFCEGNPELCNVIETLFKSRLFACVDMCSVRCNAKKCNLYIYITLTGPANKDIKGELSHYYEKIIKSLSVTVCFTVTNKPVADWLMLSLEFKTIDAC